MLHRSTPTAPANRAAALSSFASDEQNAYYGTLLAYLIGNGRPDDARLFLDDPRQIGPRVLEESVRALSLQRASAWSRSIFDAVMDRAPEFSELGELSLPFVCFDAESEKSLVHALSRLIARWGVAPPLRNGVRLLDAVASTGLDAAIDKLLVAGSRVDEDAFAALLESTELGRASGSTIRRLTVGKPSVPGVLGRYLENARGRGLGYDAIADGVEALITARVPKKRQIEDVSPVASALALDLPVADRVRLAERVIAAGYASGPIADALPEVVAMLEPAGLRELLDAVDHRPGATYGKAGRGLLHFAAKSACELALEDRDTIEARIVPTFMALIARGEPPRARDGKGKTALELANPLKRDLESAEWNRIAAVLDGAASGVVATTGTGSKSFELFPDAGLAIGVAGALVEAGELDGRALVMAWKAAAAEADDPASEGAEQLAAEALAALPVTADALASVKRLGFDFGDPIYKRFEAASGVESGGESPVLEVRSIDGVQHLSKLERLDLTAYAATVRVLAPLEGHVSLKELLLASAPEDESVLLRLPALRRVACRHLSPAIVAKLRAAGVEVTEDPSRPAAKREPQKRAAAKKPAAKKPAAKKPAAKKPAAKKPAAKKPAAKKR
jgi:hypothetical protein